MATDRLYAAYHTRCIFRLTERRFHLAAYGLPLLLRDLGADTTVGDDFHIALREQQVDQNAVVIFGIPYTQLREHFNGTFARSLPAPQRCDVEGRFDHEANLADVREFTGLDGRFDGPQAIVGESSSYLRVERGQVSA